MVKRMMEYDSVKLLHRLGDEFKEIKLPFHVRMVERVAQSYSVFRPPGQERYMIIVEIDTECSDEQLLYLREFTNKIDTVREPMINLHDPTTAEYFKSEQDAFNFTMGLDFQHRNIHRLSIKIGLEEMQVESFIRQFRYKTESLRLRVYEEEFDKQIDDHCSEDEYNLNEDDDGHK